MIQQIDHINIVVRDLNAMIDFYEKNLGFRLSKQVEISGDWIEDVVHLKDVKAKVVYLELPEGPRIELIHYLAPEGMFPDGLNIPNTYGLRHIAFRVTNIDMWVEQLQNKGVVFFGNIQAVPGSQVKYAGGVKKRLIYFYDPEGNILELCEYSKKSTGA